MFEMILKRVKLEIVQLTWKELLKFQKSIEFEKPVLAFFDHLIDFVLKISTSVTTFQLHFNFATAAKLSNFKNFQV